MSRPGFGERHPDLAVLLARHRPAATGETSWMGGAMPLRVSAYTTPTALPYELVSSVRCLVQVADLIVFCENADGSHPWPGGRRHPGESHVDTAVREVHEETGWSLNRSSLRPLGWLHLEHLAPRRPNDPYPYPDLLQLVLCGTATNRDGDPNASWIDTDGYERRSRLVTIDEAREEQQPIYSHRSSSTCFHAAASADAGCRAAVWGYARTAGTMPTRPQERAGA